MAYRTRSSPIGRRAQRLRLRAALVRLQRRSERGSFRPAICRPFSRPRPQCRESFELPARDPFGKLLFRHGKDHAWSYFKDRPHLGIELPSVFRFIVGERLLRNLVVVQLARHALGDHSLFRIFSAYNAIWILLKIAALGTGGAGAEVVSAVEPDAPHHHGVRRAVGPHGCQPVIMRLADPLAGP